jgi:hypothetical protein
VARPDKTNYLCMNTAITWVGDRSMRDASLTRAAPCLTPQIVSTFFGLHRPQQFCSVGVAPAVASDWPIVSSFWPPIPWRNAGGSQKAIPEASLC